MKEAMKTQIAAALLLYTFTVSAARAADILYSAELGVGHSDNLLRTETNPQSQSISEVGGQFSYVKRVRMADVEVLGDLAYYNYNNRRYRNELVGTLVGASVFKLLEDRLNWTVLDTFGQTQRDPFTALTPDNRENVNYLTTGPDLLLRPGNNMQLRLSGRYALVDFSKSPLDSKRASGTLSLGRNLSDTALLSANVRAAQVRFDHGFADYNNNAYYLSYALQGEHTSLTADFGASQVTGQVGRESSPLFNVSLGRDLSARFRLNLAVGQELTDASDALGQAGLRRTVSLGSLALATTTLPYKHRYASLGLNLVGRRTQLGTSVSYNRELYKFDPLQDRDLAYTELYLYREMGSRLYADVRAGVSKYHYQNRVTGDVQTVGGSGSLVLRLGSRLRLALSGDHQDYNTDVPNADYVENRLWLHLRYGDVGIRGIGAFLAPDQLTAVQRSSGARDLRSYDRRSEQTTLEQVAP